MAGVGPMLTKGVRLIPPTLRASPSAPLTLRGGADGGRCLADSAVTLVDATEEAETTDGGRAANDTISPD